MKSPTPDSKKAFSPNGWGPVGRQHVFLIG